MVVSRRDWMALLWLCLPIVFTSFCWAQPFPLELNDTRRDTFIDVLSDHNITQWLHIASLFDLRNFPDWPEHLMNFTIHLINNKTDGWHDDVLTDGAQLYGTMSDSACDLEVAVEEFLEFHRRYPHAVFGCRCSGASMAVATLCDIENVAMLSPASTSAKLSNKDEYATFSRLMAPDDDKGAVGALVRLLREFGWKRVSVINTDTQFTKDITLEFIDSWKGKHHVGEDPFVGEISYQDTIKLNDTTGVATAVDEKSVRRVLKAVPTENPDVNSRVIVLFAHHQHAFPILEIANSMGFQPDTIWVGTSEWIGREPLDGVTSWMPPVPGYLGITPYRNKSSPIYLDYLERLQDFERTNDLPVTKDLTDFVADRFADGILALAMALSEVPRDLRGDGWLVSERLRGLEFEGLSGHIALDRNGDRKDPKFTVVNLQSSGTEWTSIGHVTPNSPTVATRRVCWAEAGCVADPPSDEYPHKKDIHAYWIWTVVACLAVTSILFYFQIKKNRTVTDKLHKIEKELQHLDDDDDAAKQRKGKLYKEIAGLLGQPAPEHWTEDEGLVEVPPTQQEYWGVLAQLQSTMNEGEMCHLSKLSRVQNLGIWSYYVFRKNQLANKYSTDLNDAELLKEKSVWHGTSSLNPDVIYNDQQDGFLMQLSQQGHWGRGVYFSARSGYSDPYSYKPLTEYSDTLQEDRELFLVKLLIGESIFLDRNEGVWMEEACKALVTPPDNPGRAGKKFDTVEGEIQDEAKTRVYVVYENGRAYPEYLVRYYKGERDKSRTPYNSLGEALMHKSLTARDEAEEVVDNATGDTTTNPEDDLQSVASSVASVQAVWQYLNDSDQWENYLDGHQNKIEQAYRQDATGVVTIELFPWTYAIDFTVNLQTNLDHPNKNTRQVRRIRLNS